MYINDQFHVQQASCTLTIRSCTASGQLMLFKGKETQSICMFRLGDDDIESPYKFFLDTFDFFCIKL